MEKKLLLAFAILFGWLSVFLPVQAQEPFDRPFSISLPVSVDGETVTVTMDCTLRKQVSSEKLTIGIIRSENTAGIEIEPAWLTEEKASFRFSPAGYPGIKLKLTVTKGLKWDLTDTETEGYIGSLRATAGQVLDNGTIESAGTYYTVRDLVFDLRWIEAAPEKRPQTISLTLQYKAEGSDTWEDVADAVPEISDGVFYKTITYKNIANTGEYRLVEDTIEGYSISPESRTIAENEMLVNTQTAEVGFTKIWYDHSVAEHTRPNPDAATVQSTLSLAYVPYGSSELIPVENPNITITPSEDGKTWNISFGELPCCDENGPYTFLISEDASGWENTDYGTYVHDYGIDSVVIGDDTYILPGDIVSSTIEEDVKIVFDKVWKDGDTAPEDRPSPTFYLYRYPNDGVSGPGTLSPVSGMDYMVLSDPGQKTDGRFQFAYTDGDVIRTDAPRYDPEGYEYVYMLLESLPNDSAYQDYTTKVNGVPATYFKAGIRIGENDTDGDTLVNIREGEVTPSAVKAWQAGALKEMLVENDYVNLDIYRSVNDEWEKVDDASMTISGFSADQTFIRKNYSSRLAKYDSEGYLYTYHFVETGGSLGGQEFTVEDGVFTIGDYQFISKEDTVIDPASGDYVTAVVNRLSTDTAFAIVKTWSPTLGDNFGSVTVHMYTDTDHNPIDLSQYEITAGTLDPGDPSLLTLSSPDFSTLIKGLPKYDENGMEIAYRVKEHESLTLPKDVYMHSGTTYQEINGHPGALISNVTAVESKLLQFTLEKKWLDDNDIIGRVPVVLGIFYDNETEPFTTVELSTANGWYSELQLSIENMPEEKQDMSKWSVREIAINGNPVSYDANVIGTGNSGTTKYEVTNTHDEIIGEPGSTQMVAWTSQNLRKDTIDLKVDTIWNIGDIEWPGATGDINAQYKIRQRDADGHVTEIGTYTATKDPNDPIVIGDLPKYDGQGREYAYSVEVLTVGQGEGDDYRCTYDDDGICDFSGYDLIEKTEYKGIIPAAAADDNDVIRYEVTIDRSPTIRNLTVNKVWRDAGPETRPDIQLKLYRIPKEDLDGTTADLTAAEDITETTSMIWDTSHIWYWTCNFGDVPAFNEDGKEYAYLVTESYPHTIDYENFYYGETGGNDLPSAMGTDTKTTFPIHDDEGNYPYTFAGVNRNTTAGTIINRHSALRTISGAKVWANLPGWFDPASLRELDVYLYRTIDAGVLENMTDYFVPGNQVTDGESGPLYAILNNGKTSFEFTGMPVYDEYGSQYYYFAGEKNRDGELNSIFAFDSIIPGVNKNNPVFVNTYNGGARVKISVTKNWDWTGYRNTDLYGSKSPEITFSLHQVWGYGTEKANDIILHEKTLPSFTITADTMTIETIAFEETDIYRYAPDGSEYLYYVTESELQGYSFTAETVGTEAAHPIELSLSENDGTYKGSVTMKNTYEPGNADFKDVVKVWVDKDNSYGTRPDPADMSYVLKRTYGPDEKTYDDGEWTATTGNEWTYEFEGIFPTYATDDAEFEYIPVEYYVGDVPSVPGYLPPVVNGLKVTNRLDYVTLKLDKEWYKTVAGGTAILVDDKGNLISLHEFGAIVDQLTFDVYRLIEEEYRQNEDGPWDQAASWTKVREKTVGYEDLYYAAIYGDLITIADDLPKYYPLSNDRVRYKLVEQESGFTVDVEPEVVGDGNENEYLVKIKNTISTDDITITLYWYDENNRDDTRPEEVKVTVSSGEGDDLQQTDIKLTRANGYTYKIAVPPYTEGKTYTITQAEVENYTFENESTGTTAKDRTDGAVITGIAPGSTVIFHDTYVPPTFDAPLQKEWRDNNDMWGQRPTSVSVRLETCTDGDICATAGDWAPFAAEAANTHQISGDGNTWTETGWAGLPVHVAKEEDEIWDPAVLQWYRFVEDPVNVCYTSSDKRFNYETRNDENIFLITNWQKTTTLDIIKAWNDGNNAFNARPGSVTFTIQQKKTNDPDDPWTDTHYANGDTVVLTATADNNWKTGLRNLPKVDAYGNELVYRAVEDLVPEHYVKTEATDLQNKKTTVTNDLVFDLLITKHWIETDDEKYHPADGISFTLLRNGTGATSHTIPEGQTTLTIQDLPVYDSSGNRISYTLTEDTVPGYFSEVQKNVEDQNTSFEVYNTRLVPVTVNKVWLDGGHADERGTNGHVSILLNDAVQTPLDENGTPKTDTGTITTGANPAYAAYLPKYDHNGNELTYTAVEDTVPTGYVQVGETVDKTGDGANGFIFELTNQRVIDIPVAKNWIDSGGTRPAVTLQLLQNGNAFGDPVTLPTAGSYTFTDLPKYDEDTREAWVYSVTESYTTKGDGYYYSDPAACVPASSTADGFTGFSFTNYELLDIPVKKVWVDGYTGPDHTDGRPGSVTFTLSAKTADQTDADRNGETLTLDAESEWQGAFEGLKKYDDNKQPITYTVSESPVAGYMTELSVDAKDGTVTAVNTRLYPVTVNKIWLDGGHTAERGTNGHVSILLNDAVQTPLDENGTPKTDTGTITTGANPAYAAYLPAYDTEGKLLPYTAVEDTVPTGYVQVGEAVDKTGDGANGFIFELTNQRVIDIPVAKNWIDSGGTRPTVTLKLLQNGNAFGDPVTLPTAGSYTFTDLPKYDEDTRETWVYSVTESYTTKGDGYYYSDPAACVPASSTADDFTGFSFTNYELLDIPVKKVWVDGYTGPDHTDGRPESVTFTLSAKTADQTDADRNGETLTLDAESEWQGAFEGLKKYDDNKQPITYTVSESPVADYRTDLTVDAADGTVTATNTRLITVEVIKVWQDGNDKDETRPGSISVTLSGSDGSSTQKTLNEQNGWKETFTDLPKYDDNNQPITYTVSETGVPTGYGRENSGVYSLTDDQDSQYRCILTNTLLTDIPVRKVWNYGNDEHPTDPITVTLMNGEETVQTIQLNEENSWRSAFTDLRKYDDNGNPYAYTVKEAANPAYAVTYQPAGGEVTTITDEAVITNTELTEVPFTKEWIDAGNADHVRTEATFNLTRNGTPLQTQTIGTDKTGGVFKDLLKYDSEGKPYTYAVTEEPLIANYVSTHDGNAFTNTQVIAVTVEKIWNDGGHENLRPEKITIRLTGGTEDLSADLTAPDWSHTFTNLPKYDTNGDKYPYAVEELTVNGYQSIIDPIPEESVSAEGYKVTNTYLANIEVTKYWVDAEDKDEARPTQIRLKLYGDNVLKLETDVDVDKFPYSYEGLPLYADDGQEIAYRVEEVVPEGYTAVVGTNNVITNTRVNDVEVTWEWNDGDDSEDVRPDEVCLILKADGETVSTECFNAEDPGHTYPDLPKYDTDGDEIVYTVDAEEPTDYDVDIDEDALHITYVVKVAPKVTKIWIDGENAEETRPDQLTVTLYRDEAFHQELVLSGPDWSGSFEPTRKYDREHRPYAFDVSEVEVPKYDTFRDGELLSEEGVTFTNTLGLNITVRKIWDDLGNINFTRPMSLPVYLLADGVPAYEHEMTTADNWVWTFPYVPKYNEDRSLIEYTVDEAYVESYEKTIDGFTITNRWRPHYPGGPSLFGLEDDELPATGFSSRHVTELPPASIAYKPSGLHLEIPTLNLSTDIRVVPKVGRSLSVEWLGENAGLPETSPLPGEGQTLLIGHNHLNTMEAGPFYALSGLEANARIFVTDEDGGLQIYRVYANEKIGATDFESLSEIAGRFENTLTLLTCEDELVEGGYANRRVIAAAPVEF